MTLTTRYAMLLLLLPLPALAQYGGGNGNGEFSIAIAATQLDGSAPVLYGGGNGRGEVFTVTASTQLSGTIFNLYGGGDGRGETSTGNSTAQLDGSILNIYGGGDGRGETITGNSTAQLDGSTLNIYGGGNGRGETLIVNPVTQLDGSLLSLYGGGDGRGEVVTANNNQQLDGQAIASLYIGGNGRGEVVTQTSGQALPITLMSFGAELAGKDIKVYWQTASETNSAFFVVEKSMDGSSWQPIGTVKAAGSSNSPLSYSFFDTNPQEGLNYYRLMPTDQDGKFTYSGVAIVRYHTALASLVSVYPNPARYQLTVAVSSAAATTRLNLTLINGSGQTLWKKQQLQGNKQTIDVSSLAAGIYYLVVDNGGELSTIKVVKE